MLIFDGLSYELDAERSALQIIIGAHKVGGESLHWTFAARYTPVEEPVGRGDFAGGRELTISVFGAKMEGRHWHELEGAVDERTEGWQLTKALTLVSPVLVANPAPLRMTTRHRVQVGRRRGYYFGMEAEGLLLPFELGAQAAFGASKEAQAQMELEVQELRLLEELPLAWVGVHVPWNVSDPVRYAQKSAERLLGLPARALQPGERAVAEPLGGERRGSRELQWVSLVTPYAEEDGEG